MGLELMDPLLGLHFLGNMLLIIIRELDFSLMVASLINQDSFSLSVYGYGEGVRHIEYPTTSIKACKVVQIYDHAEHHHMKVCAKVFRY